MRPVHDSDRGKSKRCYPISRLGEHMAIVLTSTAEPRRGDDGGSARGNRRRDSR
jgi:hypothetical protein